MENKNMIIDCMVMSGSFSQTEIEKVAKNIQERLGN